MNKLFRVCFSIILLAPVAVSQVFTTVTGTAITDLSGQVWSNLTVVANLQPPHGVSLNRLTNRGFPITDNPQYIFGNSAGSFSLTVDDNVNGITPAGSFWRFSICSNTSAQCSTVDIVITGASQDITAQVNAAIITPHVNTTPTILRSYNTNQAFGGNGALFWQTTNNTLWGCQTTPNLSCPPGWVQIGGGVGGGTSVSINGVDSNTTLNFVNGPIINWSVITGGNVNPTIPGDGVATDCLIGTGIFSPCPSSTGGITGSGSSSFVPVWTGTTILGNSEISSTTQGVQIGTPTPLSGDPGVRIITNQSLTANCAGTTALPLTINPGISGCAGTQVSYSNNAATSTGLNAGFMVQAGTSNGSAGTLGIGIYGQVHTGFATTEERAGYFEANNNTNAVVTTSRGVMGASVNATGNTTTTNEGVVAQTMTQTGSTNTNDYSLHVLAPVNNGTMTTHAGLRIEPQAVGVESQLVAHVFANLPACTATYEGSSAAITDSTVSSGVITGGGTIHVLAYCNGTNWTVAGGGGASPAVLSNSTTTISADATVAATTDFTWLSVPITMPSSGCPCRVFISYGLFYITSNSGSFVAWVTDNSTSANYATSQGNQTGSATSGSGLAASGFTSTTYANSAAVTFAAKTWTTSTSMTVKAGNAKGPPTQNSWLNLAVMPSQ